MATQGQGDVIFPIRRDLSADVAVQNYTLVLKYQQQKCDKIFHNFVIPCVFSMPGLPGQKRNSSRNMLIFRKPCCTLAQNQYLCPIIRNFPMRTIINIF